MNFISNKIVTLTEAAVDIANATHRAAAGETQPCLLCDTPSRQRFVMPFGPRGGFVVFSLCTDHDAKDEPTVERIREMLRSLAEVQ